MAYQTTDDNDDLYPADLKAEYPIMNVFTLDKLNKENNRLIAENYLLRRAIELRKQNAKLRCSNILASILAMLDESDAKSESLLTPVSEALRRHFDGTESPNVASCDVMSDQSLDIDGLRRSTCSMSPPRTPSPAPEPPNITGSDLDIEPEGSCQKSADYFETPSTLNTNDLKSISEYNSKNGQKPSVIFVNTKENDPFGKDFRYTSHQSHPEASHSKNRLKTQDIGIQVKQSAKALRKRSLLQSASNMRQKAHRAVSHGRQLSSHLSDHHGRTSSFHTKCLHTNEDNDSKRTLSHGYVWEKHLREPIATSTPILGKHHVHRKHHEKGTASKHKLKADIKGNTDVQEPSLEVQGSPVAMTTNPLDGDASATVPSHTGHVYVSPGHGEVYDYHHRIEPADTTGSDSDASPRYIEDMAKHIRPTKRIIGEIAFQLDRRILHYVYNGKNSGVKIDRKRFYGYTLANLEQMLQVDSCDPDTGKLNHKQWMTLKYRLDYIVRSLHPLGYTMSQHPSLAIKLVNKYGLLHTYPESGSIEEKSINNPRVVQYLLRSFVPRHELRDVLIILESLVLLSHDDGKTLFLW